MHTIKTTICYSLLFSVVMEFQINVLIKGTPANMIGVILLYFLLGLITFYTVPWIMRRFSSTKRGFWVALTTHGLLGLIVIEWSIMGNTLKSIPDLFLTIVAQLGMFAWWGTIAAMPYMLQHPAAAVFKKKILWFYAAYALISTSLAIPFGMAPVILFEPPVYLSFFYFYRKFGRSLANYLNATGPTV